MSNILVTNIFKQYTWTKKCDVSTDTLNAVLLYGTSALEDNVIKQWEDYDDLSSYEIAGEGYTPLGQELSGVYETSATGNAGIRQLMADDVSWPSSSITSDAVAIIDTAVDNIVVCYIPFGVNKSSTLGTFLLNWPSSGILNIY
jgi:hypothetical protein